MSVLHLLSLILIGLAFAAGLFLLLGYRWDVDALGGAVQCGSFLRQHPFPHQDAQWLLCQTAHKRVRFWSIVVAAALLIGFVLLSAIPDQPRRAIPGSDSGERP